MIVDDHAIVRAGLTQILRAEPQIVVAAEAENAAEAVAKLERETVDVVVLDLSLPDSSGFRVLSHVATAGGGVPVLILSMEREEEYAVLALRAGAAGYLEKRTAPELLVAAIRQVVAGKKYMSRELAERVAMGLDVRAALEHPHEILSPREFEVFLAIAAGKPVREIASALRLSVKTVNNHRAHVLSKLGMKSNAELIRYAMRQRLVH